MPIQIREYLPLLKEAVAEAKAVGLGKEVEELDRTCTAAFTTSSEMLQEHGLAIRRLLKSAHQRVPPSTKKKLQACLNETELAASGLRKLVAVLKRPEKLC